MPKKRWISQWQVSSESSADSYTVSLKLDQTYACACPRWKFAKAPKPDCKHIKSVRGGDFDPIGVEPRNEPEFELAMISEVTPVLTNGVVTKVQVPLYPMGDTHFQATLVFDCLKYGVRFQTLRDRYDIAKRNSRNNLIGYVIENGRRIYGPWDEKSCNLVGYDLVLVTQADLDPFGMTLYRPRMIEVHAEALMNPEKL